MQLRLRPSRAIGLLPSAPAGRHSRASRTAHAFGGAARRASASPPLPPPLASSLRAARSAARLRQRVIIRKCPSRSLACGGPGPPASASRLRSFLAPPGVGGPPRAALVSVRGSPRDAPPAGIRSACRTRRAFAGARGCWAAGRCVGIRASLVSSGSGRPFAWARGLRGLAAFLAARLRPPLVPRSAAPAGPLRCRSAAAPAPRPAGFARPAAAGGCPPRGALPPGPPGSFPSAHRSPLRLSIDVRRVGGRLAVGNRLTGP